MKEKNSDMFRKSYVTVITALILSTAAPAVSPALPAMAASYVNTEQKASPVLYKDSVQFVKKGQNTYCLSSNGAQTTGWVQKSGKWYYFDKKDGHMLTGWLTLKSRKFYLQSDGSMIAGPRWYNVGGKRYYFTKNGHVRSAWEMIGGKWYFRDTTGTVVKNNWIKYAGKYYYLTSTGAAATGKVSVNGKKLTFDADCALVDKVTPTIVASAKAAEKSLAVKTQNEAAKTEKATAASNKTTAAAGKTTAATPSATAEKSKTEAATKNTASAAKSTAPAAPKAVSSSKKTNKITKVTGKLNNLPESKRQFVIDIANYVRKYAPKYGIKVYSPIIAQAIHESGWGQSSLSAKYHNYFGLKCGTLWTGKSVNLSTKEEYSAGSLTTIRSNFRVYDNMEQGVKGYFEFIQLPRYSNLKGVTSPKQYLTNIKNDGYATGYLYVDHTMALVDLYDLTQFDK